MQRPIIAERYELIKEIARGGMGVVYQAEHLALKRKVAVKLLSANFAQKPAALKRFEREAQVMARLDHPQMVKVYDFGVDKAGVYLAMEYVDGVTLENEIYRNGKMAAGRATRIAIQVLEVLAHAHERQVIHRDIKPANVMLVGDEGVDLVKVLDFGIALLRDNEGPDNVRLTSAGNVLGTALYMSPEQVRAEEITPLSDLYSVGCVLFEMLQGRPPFEGVSQAEVFAAHLYVSPPSFRDNPGDSVIAVAVEQCVQKLLAKKPGDRFKSALDAAQALSEAAFGVKRGEVQGRGSLGGFVASSVSDGVSKRIFIVDDGTDAASGVSLQLVVNTSGARLVKNAEEADLIIVVSSSAPQALAVAARWQDKSKVPVAISCPDSLEVVNAAVSAGLYDVIPTPIDPGTAARKIARVKRRKSA
jgi:serine/threonine protein kinase